MALNDANVDESIAADWKEILERHAVEEPEPSATTPEPAAEPTDEPPEQKVAPARDESGKFVKAEKQDGESKQTKETQALQQDDRQAVGAQPAVEVDRGAVRDVNKAPSSWKPTARAEYDKLPPAIKAEIHRREQDFQNGQTQLLPDAQFGKSLRQTIEPYRMLIEAEGGTPERAVADLLRTAAIFRVGTPQQKLQAVAGIATQFGVDLTPLYQQQQGQQASQPAQQVYRDPRVDQLLADQQRQNTERQQREMADLESTVTQWMNAVDTQGNPTRPYAADVINEMYALIPQLREANPVLTNAQLLEEAYNRATWAHPEVRTLLQQKAAADREAQRQAENQTRVREARRAASVNVPRRASTPTPAKPGRIEDTIAETARELGLIT